MKLSFYLSEIYSQKSQVENPCKNYWIFKINLMSMTCVYCKKRKKIMEKLKAVKTIVNKS